MVDQLWPLLAAAQQRTPEAVAVHDATGDVLTYRQLHAVAAGLAARLAEQGVAQGDSVAIATRRGRKELVAVLAVLRLGAVCFSLPPSVPPLLARAMLDEARARLVVGDRGRFAALGPALRDQVTQPIDLLRPAELKGPVAVPGDAAPAHLWFRIGKDGRPSPSWTSRGELAKLHAWPLESRASVLRLAPLALGRSMAEIMLPLLASGTVRVFPGVPVKPLSLGKFVAEQSVTGLVLDVSRCSQIASYRPAALASARELIVTGGRLPDADADRIAEACPQLRNSHPEAAWWATVPGESLPCDQDAIITALAEHPEVNQAAVAPGPGGQLIAAVVAVDDPSLPEELRVHVANHLPSSSVPSQWVIVPTLPLTDDGALDVRRLRKLAAQRDPGRITVKREPAQPAAETPDYLTAIRQAWQDVLGPKELSDDLDFFEAGGTSFMVLALRNRLRDRLPGRTVSVQDLYRYPTVATFAARLHDDAEKERSHA